MVDFKPYIENETIGFKKGEEIRSELNGRCSNQRSTIRYSIQQIYKVLFYNADILKQYSVKAPTTLDELKEAAKTIYEKSKHEVVGCWFRLIKQLLCNWV